MRTPRLQLVTREEGLLPGARSWWGSGLRCKAQSSGCPVHRPHHFPSGNLRS